MTSSFWRSVSTSRWRLRTIRALLQRTAAANQQQFEFLEAHPVIRPLSDYSLESLRQFRQERTR